MKTLPQDYSWLCRWSEDTDTKEVNETVRKVPAEYTPQLPARLHSYLLCLVVVMLLIALMLIIYLKHHFTDG